MIGLSSGQMGSRLAARVLVWMTPLCFAGCRLDNPAYFQGTGGLEVAQHRSDADTDTTQSKDPGTTAQELLSDSSVDGSKTSASGSATQAPQESGSSSTLPPKPSCGQGEQHCYEMRMLGSDFVGNSGQSPFLGVTRGSPDVRLDDKSESPLFQQYLRFTETAVLSTREAVKTGAGGAYGFDLTIRQARCMGGSRCGLGSCGPLGIEIDTVKKVAICASILNNERNREVELSVELDEINTIGCSLTGNKVTIYVNDQTGHLDRVPQDPVAEVTAYFGAQVEFGEGGLFNGEIGRMRVWDDPEAMRQANQDR